MKFCDKLAKQRKNNNLSQEQLAEKLNVSRQAVSKWESGSSYPDMEKIIQICGILNCTLEDILDDGTIKTNSNQNSKININNYIQDLLKFITKTYNMFCSMKIKQRIKCITEILFISLIVFLLGAVIFSIVNSITYNVLNFIPSSAKFFIESIFESIYIIILLIIGSIIILHLFKIRYLDYYITIEDKNVDKRTIEPAILDRNETMDNSKKEKIIIRDPEHSSFSFFSLLGKIVIYSIKIFIAMLALPLICFCLLLIVMVVISIVHISYTILFLFIAIAFLGSVLLSLLLIYFLYNFIFSRKQPLKMIFIVFIISLILIGSGIGLSCTTVLNYHTYDIKNSGKTITKIEYIDLKEDTQINLLDNYNTEYIIDNSINNMKLEISYPEIFNYKLFRDEDLDENNKKIDNYHLYVERVDIFKCYKIIIDNLKKKRFINYTEDFVNIKITLSQENYNHFIK